MIGTAFLMCLFGFPETKWHRVHPGELPKVQSEKMASTSVGKVNIETEEGSDPEKSSSPDLTALSHAATSERDLFLGKGTPSKKQFMLWQANAHPFKTIFLDLWIPWKLFAFPIVEFASFVVSWSASSFLTVNLTQSQAFSAPPYNFSPLAIGFFNFAVLVGGIIGLVTAGPLSDWVSMRLTRRNNGIREPEMRLVTMIPFVLIMILGNFIVAFGWQQGLNWKVSTEQHACILQIGYYLEETTLTISPGDCDYWMGMCRNSSRSFAVNCLYLHRRLVQTCGRFRFREHHGQ